MYVAFYWSSSVSSHVFSSLILGPVSPCGVDTGKMVLLFSNITPADAQRRLGLRYIVTCTRIRAQAGVRSAQRGALREINVDPLVSRVYPAQWLCYCFHNQMSYSVNTNDLLWWVFGVEIPPFSSLVAVVNLTYTIYTKESRRSDADVHCIMGFLKLTREN